MTEGAASSAEGAQAQPTDGLAMDASEARKGKGKGKKSRTTYHLREIVTIAGAHRMDFNQLIDPLSQTVKNEPDDSSDADSDRTPNSTTTASTLGVPQATTERAASSASGSQAPPADGWAMIGPEASRERKKKGVGKKTGSKKKTAKRDDPTKLREAILCAAESILADLRDGLISVKNEDITEAKNGHEDDTAMETDASEGHSQDEGMVGSVCHTLSK